MAMLALQGVIPPMMTPFTAAGEIDYGAHARNIARWNKDDLGGYLVLGSNSETPYLNETEKLKLIESTVSHAAAGRVVIAGTGLESSRETIRLTNLAAEQGARAALVLTPSFYGSQMTDASLVNHFRLVADSARIPILIYNVPAYTHLSISVTTVGILSNHPNIIGIKDSSGDIPRLALLMNEVASSFNVVMGNASSWYPSLTLGVRTGILALANFAGGQCSQIQKYFDAGEYEKARVLHLRLVPVNAAVTSVYGVPGLKYAATLFGYESGFLRSPLAPLDENAQRRIREIVKIAQLL